MIPIHFRKPLHIGFIFLNTFLPGWGSAAAGEMISDGKPSVEGKAPVLPPVSAADRSRFRISAGAGYRSLDKVEFKSGSRSGGLRLPFMAAVQARQGSSA